MTAPELIDDAVRRLVRAGKDQRLYTESKGDA